MSGTVETKFAVLGDHYFTHRKILSRSRHINIIKIIKITFMILKINYFESFPGVHYGVVWSFRDFYFSPFSEQVHLCLLEH